MAKKVARDPNAPKRNLSAYLLYQNAMRDQFKAMNPGMTFGELSKYTSACYADLSPSEKQSWVERAEEDKLRYQEELESYVPPHGYDSKGDAIANPVPEKGGKKGKPVRDINAPKRNLSAYLLYQNAMRDQFKSENPGMTFGQLSKYTSHMYKNLTPEEKAMWDNRAAEDKQRYDHEISHYHPPPGHDSRGILIEDQQPRRRAKRAPKDPMAPKRASGAYVFFTNDMRPKVLAEFPGIKFVDLGKVMGERWRALTSEEKKQYEDLAEEDKQRYQMEQQQFQANKQAEQAQEQPHIPAASATYFEHDPSEAAAIPFDAYGMDGQVAQIDPYSQYHA